jgi:phosphatidylinositol-3-phosphatase
MNAKPRAGRRLALLVTAGCTALGVALVPALTASASVRSVAHSQLPVPPGAIKHIIVIELENESEGETFGASSPAT